MSAMPRLHNASACWEEQYQGLTITGHGAIHIATCCQALPVRCWLGEIGSQISARLKLRMAASGFAQAQPGDTEIEMRLWHRG